MSGAHVLEQARSLGIVLYRTGSTLRYEAPKGRLSPELRAALAAHKGEILGLLEDERLPRASPEQVAELRCLVPEQCARYGEPDRERCLREALSDPEDALVAYRLLASQTIYSPR